MVRRGFINWQASHDKTNLIVMYVNDRKVFENSSDDRKFYCTPYSIVTEKQSGNYRNGIGIH